MKRHHDYPDIASAGGGTSNILFYEVAEPGPYVGGIVATALSTVFKTVEGGATALKRWRWERQTRNALASLDNATLADIGIARSEIPAIARVTAKNPTFAPTHRSRWRV